MGTKTCERCGAQKYRRYRPDGRKAGFQCPECAKRRSRKSWAAKSPDSRAELNKKRRLSEGEKARRLVKRRALPCSRCGGQRKLRAGGSYPYCPRCHGGQVAAWKRENADKVAAHKAARRARVHGLPSDGSGPSEWALRTEDEDLWYCHLCGNGFRVGETTHWDHRDPISGGSIGTVLSNMAIAHASCNAARRNTPLSEWHILVGVPEGVV